MNGGFPRGDVQINRSGAGVLDRTVKKFVPFPEMSDRRQLTPRGKQRRHELMAYAATRFAEGGFHPTSVAEIVGGLGVGKGVFYWYFDSKDQLFIEILRDAQ